MTLDFQFLKLPIGDFDASRINGVVQTGLDSQASVSFRSTDEFQYGFVVQQRLCGPIHADEREHSVLNQIPF